MRRRVFSLLIVLAFAVVVLLFGARVWREGALGCARAFEKASYCDPDELDRLGVREPDPTMPAFTDSAYDEVFPDLYETPNGEAE